MSIEQARFMSNIILKGEAEEVPGAELISTVTWYIPYHSIYHPQKPEKMFIRIWNETPNIHSKNKSHYNLAHQASS